MRKDLQAAARLVVAAAPVATACYAALAVVAGFGPVAATMLLRLILDGITAPGPSAVARMAPVVGALAVVGLLIAVLPSVRQLLRERMQRAVARHSMDQLYRATGALVGIGRMESPTFRDQLRLAQQSGRSGPDQIVDDTLGAAESLITLTGFIGLLLALNPWLAVVVLASAGPALGLQLRLNRAHAVMMWETSGHARREMHYGDLLTSLTAAKELRLFGLGDLFRQRMLTEMLKAHREQDRQDLREVRAQGTLSALSALISAGAVVWGVITALRGGLSVGDVSVLIAAVASVQQAVQALVARMGSMHQAMLLFRHFREILAIRDELEAPATPLTATPLRDGIEFSDVWFRYGPDKPWVLRGVSFTIPCGRSLALVGHNGAGKSTVIKLLCRFYDPTLGSITWDGLDLRTMRADLLRERIGAVFQDYMQYELTAAENIGVGDVAGLTDRDRVTASARQAGVHDVLEALPKGYDTLLSNTFYDEADRENPETGIVLSGGQWQRVALARAFLRDQRDLMILDEPAAGLDAEAEHELHLSLTRRRAGRTSVLISHRLGSIRDADRIIVLADGKVAEHGKHEELLAAQGIYARLFHLQADGYRTSPAVTA